MTTAQFFEKFNLFAGAPNAIPRLRQLILELAVRGQLTSATSHPSAASHPSAPSDPSAAAIPLNHSPFTSSWRVVLLADVLKNRSGNSKLIKGKLHDTPAAHLFQGFSASGADVWCDDFEHEGRAIIVSAVGARCGKAFKAAGKWAAIANTNIVRPDPEHFDFDFAYLVLNDEAFWVRGGSAQPFVKFPPSFDRYFALPPLAEQKRIVAKVDELMALCDQLEAQQQERETKHAALAQATLARFAEAPTPTNLNLLFHSSFSIQPSDLRKTILTLAIQGKLVPQDTKEKQAPDLEQQSKSAAILPFALPKGWKQTQLEQLALINGGFAFQSTAYTSKGARVVRISDFDELGFKDHKIVRHLFTPDLQKFSLAEGDILMAMTGGTVGKSYLVRSLPEQMVVNQRVATIRAKDFVHSHYLDLVIRSEMTQAVIHKAKNSTNDNISMVDIRGFVVPLPPLAEQKRIVAKVEELMALVDALEAQQAAADQAATHLLDAVVSELAAAA